MEGGARAWPEGGAADSVAGGVRAACVWGGAGCWAGVEKVEVARSGRGGAILRRGVGRWA